MVQACGCDATVVDSILICLNELLLINTKAESTALSSATQHGMTRKVGNGLSIHKVPSAYLTVCGIQCEVEKNMHIFDGFLYVPKARIYKLLSFLRSILRYRCIY